MNALRKSCWIGLLATFLSCSAQAQVTPASPAVSPRPDTVRIGSSALATGGDTVRTQSAADTIRLNARQTAQIRKIVPRKASIRSAILPGLGQAYNRQYWKIPIIYGGFATIGYFIVDMNKRTQFYLGAWKRAYNSPSKTTDVTLNGIFYEDVPETRLERGYNTFRRYRDLNVLLGVALWALNIVDANVTAHLKTFDLSDDLSAQLQPSLGAGGQIAPGVRLTLRFK